MDQSHEGLLQYYRGVPYYSPNSMYPSKLLLGATEGPDTLEKNPFKPELRGPSRVRYSDFVNPRRWTPDFSWIHFIPSVPSQTYSNPNSYLGRLLHRFPAVLTYISNSGEVKGFKISEDSPWIRLEADLYGAVTALSHHYRIQCVLPFLPNVIGYQKMYGQRRQLDARLLQAREWFFVWFGALSYLVAALRDPPSGGRLPQPDRCWQSVLRASGLSPTFIDGISSSLSEATWSSLGRAGVIVDIAKPPEGQPHVSWFVMNGVPVWYPWGEAEERLAMQALRPPVALLPLRRGDSDDCPGVARARPVTPATAPQGDPPPNSPLGPLTDLTESEPTGHHLPPHPGGQSQSNASIPSGRDPAWVSFFQTRERAHARILENETEQRRQTRENRARQPPTSSAPVFEWYRNYLNDEEFTYERLPVLAKARFDTLESYGEAQKRYDPFFNEWDCCDEWGPDDPGSDDGMSPYREGSADDHPLLPAVVDTLVPIERRSALEVPSYTECDRPNGILVDDCLSEGFLRLVEEVFGRFYGFTRPAQTLASTSSASGEDELLIRILGNAPNSVTSEAFKGYSSTEHYQSGKDFITALCSCSGPRAESWDLRDNCTNPVRLTPQFRLISIRHLHSPDAPEAEAQVCYVFDDGKGHPPWKLGVMSAAAALLVCRLPGDYNPYDVASVLIGYGLPFRVFYPSRMLHRPLSSRPALAHAIPIRPFGHKFTKEDYDAYVHTRTLLLGQTHMQAALKRGGIVWRLAVGTLGTSGVTQPPSMWGSVSRVEFSAREFVDDAMTTMELDLLCDDGKERSLKSWWPLARYYEKPECGENYGRWTIRREAWYRNRLNSIEGCDSSNTTSNPQPLSYTEWKSSQHGTRKIRVLHQYLEQSSKDLLALHIADVPTP